MKLQKLGRDLLHVAQAYGLKKVEATWGHTNHSTTVYSDGTQVTEHDAASLAVETLEALGWVFDGQCWVQLEGE